MTECNQERFEFASTSGTRQIVAEFSGGTISSDAGSLLLKETDAKMNLLARFSQCFSDRRNPLLIEHTLEQMRRQRVYGLALGYEDLNDHDALRLDPLLASLAGKAEPGTDLLAGKSTLNRLELGTGTPSRYKKVTFWRDSVDELLVDIFLEAHPVAPAQIVLDIDTTDMALHGNQEDKFYHGYYKHYCYLPLYIFCGDHVLCARLRPSSIGPAVGSRKEVERIVKQIRQHWPSVEIILRGDSGFCADELLRWCENNRVDYVVGVARNQRWEKLIDGELAEAKRQVEATPPPTRIFVEFEHKTLQGAWNSDRRVVAKAEHINGKSNPRFIVTSLKAGNWEKQKLYEELYCGRGDMENRIKEQFVLFADRVSVSTMRGNQLRIYLSVIAYTLMNGLRRFGLKSTALATAQVGTIRLKVLKIGALIQVTVRKVWVLMASSYPYQALFSQVLQQLRT
ncbi:MAG: IS1380 family transposase [Usitatibacteraceae bacterium]